MFGVLSHIPFEVVSDLQLMCLLHDNQIACVRLMLKKGGAECEMEQLASAIDGLGHRGPVRAMALATDAYTFASGAQVVACLR